MQLNSPYGGQTLPKSTTMITGSFNLKHSVKQLFHEVFESAKVQIKCYKPESSDSNI